MDHEEAGDDYQPYRLTIHDLRTGARVSTATGYDLALEIPSLGLARGRAVFTDHYCGKHCYWTSLHDRPPGPPRPVSAASSGYHHAPWGSPATGRLWPSRRPGTVPKWRLAGASPWRSPAPADFCSPRRAAGSPPGPRTRGDTQRSVRQPDRLLHACGHDQGARARRRPGGCAARRAGRRQAHRALQRGDRRVHRLHLDLARRSAELDPPATESSSVQPADPTARTHHRHRQHPRDREEAADRCLHRGHSVPWLGASSGPSTAAAAGSSAPCACPRGRTPAAGQPAWPRRPAPRRSRAQADPPLLDEHLQAVERSQPSSAAPRRKGVSGGFDHVRDERLARDVVERERDERVDVRVETDRGRVDDEVGVAGHTKPSSSSSTRITVGTSMPEERAQLPPPCCASVDDRGWPPAREELGRDRPRRAAGAEHDDPRARRVAPAPHGLEEAGASVFSPTSSSPRRTTQLTAPTSSAERPSRSRCSTTATLWGTSS